MLVQPKKCPVVLLWPFGGVDTVLKAEVTTRTQNKARLQQGWILTK